MPRTPAEEDHDHMEGFPADGDPVVSGGPAPQPSPEPQAPADPLVDLRTRLDRVERENENLRRMIPPAEAKPARTAAEPELEPEPDWEKELFANPTATLKKFGERIEAKVTKQLRTEYQKDRGTSDFWNRFYDMHPDLKADHDLVEVTLNSNIAALANIRVEDAYGKLAELTRDRILRYAGGAARSRKPKARAEGGGPSPASRPAPAAPDEPQGGATISSFLKERRQRRRGQAA